MKSAKRIEKLISKINVTPASSDEKLNEILAAQEASKTILSAGMKPNVWSIIMHKKMIKFAAAAVVMAVGILGITFFNKTSNPVYALEQSLKAMENIGWMHAVPYSEMKGAENVFGETWFSATHKISAVKRKDGSAEITYFGKDECYQYDPAKGTITVLLPGKTDILSKANSYADLAAEIIDSLNDHEGTEVKTTTEEQDGGKVTVTEVKVPKGESGTEVFRFTTDESTSLPLRLELGSYNEKGEFIEVVDMAFDYPDNGPLDIYQLGAKKTAKIIDKRPGLDVQTIIENYRTARENDPSHYTAAVLCSRTNDRSFEVVESATIYYVDGNKYRSESFLMDLDLISLQDNGKRNLRKDMGDSLEPVLSWWSDRNLLDRRIAEMYDGKYKHNIAEYFNDTTPKNLNKNTKSRVRKSKVPNLLGMYTAGTQFIANVSNDSATEEQTITLIENEYSRENGLLCLQRLEEDGRFPFMRDGRRFKILCYIDPNKDYICVRLEEYFIQDELWKKLYKRADSSLVQNPDTSLGYTKQMVRESTELGQGGDGRWYPEKIEMRTVTQQGSGKLQESISTFKIYLDTERAIPEDTFDSDAFSKYLK